MTDIQLPALSTFLDRIDPNKTIDRNKAVLDFAEVSLGMTLQKLKLNLDDIEKKEFDMILSSDKKEIPSKLGKFLKKIGKLEKFTTFLGESFLEVQKDYIKVQIKALSEEKRIKLFLEFPELDKFSR